MAELQRLQFSVGPVQGFVAQSRRTRDLWGSSLLLSHLAEAAIKAVAGLGGNIVLPAWDAASRSVTDYGTVPNRFVADVVNGQAAADAARSALLAAWKQVANAVCDKYVEPVAGFGHGTQDIWDRQVDHFWEISWVVGDVNKSEHLLASRKNWRTTSATVEPGDHCTMMGDRQELSGHIRSVAPGKQKDFWTQLRSQEGVGKLDLGIDERLCAISLIKRLFPKVADKAIDRPLKHTSWPSTAYVAAIPWLKVASNEKTKSLAKAYGANVRRVAENSLGERMNRLPRLKELRKDTGDFLSLDGNFFQASALKNPKTTPFREGLSEPEEAEARRQLLEELHKLCKDVGSKPSAFYALLLMDGDSMGALLGAARQSSNRDGEKQATRALSQFSLAVPKIVGKHDGITIYAGGDDVLVMLPLAGALACAIDLTDEYQARFRVACGEDIAKQATLSGAIVYARYHTPLRDVLATGHHLLDDVAKDATGRDSLAVAVFKGSGITAQWSAPWKHIRLESGGNVLDDLVDRLRQKDASGRGEFSSGFLYNVRERFAALTDSALTRPGEYGRLATELQADALLKDVLVADYLRGLSHRQDNQAFQAGLDEATNSVTALLTVSQRVTRQPKTSDAREFELVCEQHSLGMDGALLVRFLASGGKDEIE